ncbi:MAG: CofH family radical SAM protein [Nitrospirae bacterium]|nr:CofH family radical SAM protein [Nitrospirota bacterium]
MTPAKIKDKVYKGERLTTDDALKLFHSDDLFTIGRLASHVSYKRNGNNAYFIQNIHINPTNICVNRCKFCAFSRSKGEKGAYELSIKDIIRKLKTQNSEDKSPHPPFNKGGRGGINHASRITHHSLSEVHIVGGLHPDWKFDFYLEMLKQIKRAFPRIHIKAFTAVEVDYFSKISGLSLTDTLKALKKAGLDSMPGGGAEIFNKRIRNKICPEKIDGRRWLEVMERAHRVGIKTNATMLYGHIEKYEHRIEHMLKLRELQDKTGGFQAFIPLAFHQKNTRINISGYTSGIDDLMTISIARLFLDNFPYIKAYWIMLGEKIAQLALLFGADDLDGTVTEEKITHSAGALSNMAMSKTELINLIRKAGKVPVERDSFYNPVII